MRQRGQSVASIIFMMMVSGINIAVATQQAGAKDKVKCPATCRMEMHECFLRYGDRCVNYIEFCRQVCNKPAG